MQTIQNAISGILIKAALAVKDNSTKKQRIMTLWENVVISAATVERLFSDYGLQGE